MHLKKCRLFLILVKEKEANLVIKQNVNILSSNIFYRLKNFRTITKLQQFKNWPN